MTAERMRQYQILFKTKRLLAFDFWGRKNETTGESEGGLLDHVSIGIEGMSIQSGHCLCFDCHRAELSWSSSKTVRTEAGIGDRKSGPACLGNLFPLLQARRSKLVAMFGAFRPTSVAFGGLLWSVCHLLGPQKAEQPQENAMEVVHHPQGECACPPQKGGRSY